MSLMRVSEFVGYLKTQFPFKFYASTIDKKEEKCIGVYSITSGMNNIAVGGLNNTSYAQASFTLLIHWTSNSNLCENVANRIFDELSEKADFLTTVVFPDVWDEDVQDFISIGESFEQTGQRRIAAIQMLDGHPISMPRTENNIAEMVIRVNIIYEREVIAI